MDGPQGSPPADGVSANGSQADLISLLQALEAIYNPASSNSTRRQATEFLDVAKRDPQAPAHGRTLAMDRAQPAPLRYYGLTMLEHALKYSWDDFSADQRVSLRLCAVELAFNVTADDPVYVRNKVAQLWTEAAKRAWGDEWLDMDAQLVQLWQNSLHHQAVVLYVLETLSEEIFNREDTTAGLRADQLARAMVDIFTPQLILQQQMPNRGAGTPVRCGDEGWLQRMCANLTWCLGQDVQSQPHIQTCAVKTMAALRACMSWIMPKAVVATHTVQHVFRALSVPVPELQLASVELLQSVYSRHSLRIEDLVELVTPMLTTDSIELLRQVYDWTLSDMDVHDINEHKYTLCKKLSELTNNLGLFIKQKDPEMPNPPGSDFPALFTLLFHIAKHPSLFVSISAIHCWSVLLWGRDICNSDAISQMTPLLLAICSQRLIRYESFPEDSEDITMLFLNEDVDTIPERHVFLGNYRRYCTDIVEVLVEKNANEAMPLILQNATTVLQTLYADQPPFQPATISKTAIPVLRVDAQATVLGAALKGYNKWVYKQEQELAKSDHQDGQTFQNTIKSSLEQWCRDLMDARFDDPEIIKQIVQLVSTFSTKALSDRPDFVLVFLEHLLTMKLEDDKSLTQYSDSVHDLLRICGLQMQALAFKFPDEFMGVYDVLEHQIDQMIAMPGIDPRQVFAFRAFLFSIIHRCSTLDPATQKARLRQMLVPVAEAWSNDELSHSLSSFPSFCTALGVERLPEFLSNHNFRGVEDWSEQPLPAEGQAMQATIQSQSQKFPLRLTKSLLNASVEKLRDPSPAFALAEELWAEALPAMLPNILKLVSHAQAFNNVDSNWSSLPPELQQVVRRVLTDRFWQAGISTESREDFFARVGSSKSTYEGFASTIRGTVRQIRESSYFILYTLSRFSSLFYSIDDLPEPLSQALFGNASALSAHHFNVLLSVSTHLLEGCPSARRAVFLPHMVTGLFRELDAKITSEWGIVNRRIAEAGEDDNLNDEMKTESVLRQLTHSSATLVNILLEPRAPHGTSPSALKHGRTDAAGNAVSDSIFDYVCSTPAVLKPILLFCNTLLTVRDTRSVTTVVGILRHKLLPRFTAASSPEDLEVRNFLVDDVLKSAITALHDHYFVECQKELAGLIAAILRVDSPVPRDIIMSLPGMSDRAKAEKIDRRLARLQMRDAVINERFARSIVLDMLQGLRGVGVSEWGKVEVNRGVKGKGNSNAFKEAYMAVDAPAAGTRQGIVRGGEEELEGVAGLFGDA